MKKIWVHNAKSFEDAERFDPQIPVCPQMSGCSFLNKGGEMDRHGKPSWPALGIALVLVVAGSLEGCAMMFIGHRINAHQLSMIQLGVTTEHDMLQMLGEPEAVVHKAAEGMTVYQYREVTATTLAIPFIISFGRSAQRSRGLNVMVKDGRVIDYEETETNEPLLP